MELNLDGQVAIVTGGSKGIGRATALSLLGEGAQVLVCARGPAALEEIVGLAKAQGRGDTLETLAADLTRPEDIEAVIARAQERFGRVDILVNNAGSARPGPFFELSDEAWKDDLELKFFGYMRMARAIVPVMEAQGGGVILNVTGTGGLRPVGGYMIGGAANAALFHFTKALADECAARQVRVVGVTPGPILTERLELFLSTMSPDAGTPEEALRSMTPIGRVGQPQEVADLILFLVSPRAAFIHGANVTIDGGGNPGLMG